MRIEILVGMIASGKSTYARRRAVEGALVVSHDDLTQMLHGGAYRYEQGLRDAYRMMEERLVWAALFAQRDVVVDRTHLTRESRRRWVDFRDNLQLSCLAKIDIVAVAFEIEAPCYHANRRMRAGSRGRSYEDWLNVACHHSDQAEAEPLGDDEGFDEIVRMPAMEATTR